MNLPDKYRYTVADIMAVTGKSRCSVLKIIKELNIKPERTLGVRGEKFYELRKPQAIKVLAQIEKRNNLKR